MGAGRSLARRPATPTYFFVVLRVPPAGGALAYYNTKLITFEVFTKGFEKCYTSREKAKLEYARKT
jgi:hypothetical protein